MPETTYPRAPRLLNALGLGLISAVLTAGSVIGGMLVLRPAGTDEDFAGMWAFLLTPPAQFVVGSWFAWYVLGGSWLRPMWAWGISTCLGFALVAGVMLGLGLAELNLAPRLLGLALLGLLLGGGVLAQASRYRRRVLLAQSARGSEAPASTCRGLHGYRLLPGDERGRPRAHHERGPWSG